MTNHVTDHSESYLFLGTCLNRLQFLIFLPCRHLMFDYLRGWTKNNSSLYFKWRNVRIRIHIKSYQGMWKKKELGHLVPSFRMTWFFQFMYKTAPPPQLLFGCVLAFLATPLHEDTAPFLWVCSHETHQPFVRLLMRHTFCFTCTASLALPSISDVRR